MTTLRQLRSCLDNSLLFLMLRTIWERTHPCVRFVPPGTNRRGSRGFGIETAPVPLRFRVLQRPTHAKRRSPARRDACAPSILRNISYFSVSACPAGFCVGGPVLSVRRKGVSAFSLRHWRKNRATATNARANRKTILNKIKVSSLAPAESIIIAFAYAGDATNCASEI